jgi:hypothetical protein
MSYTEQMGSRGLTPAPKVLMVKVVDDEEEATARLSLAPRSRVLKLERLRYAAGGEPFALETCYLPADTFAKFAIRETRKRFALFHSAARLPSGIELFRRRSRCYGCRSSDRGIAWTAKTCATIAHSAGDLFHERRSHPLCAGTIPFGPSQPGYSKISIVGSSNSFISSYRLGDARLFGDSTQRIGGPYRRSVCEELCENSQFPQPGCCLRARQGTRESDPS